MARLRPGAFLLLLTLSLGVRAQQERKSEVEWITTTRDKPWQLQSGWTLKPYRDENVDLTLDLTQLKQTIRGFGGCFNELGWEALSVLSDEEREKVLKSLFDPNEGCRFNLCRMPMGANDYSKSWYSYDETAEDFELKDFSIDRDKNCLIAYIRSAQKINPDLKVWASPWCPPSWMKTNRHYACSSDNIFNDLPPDKAIREMEDGIRSDKKILAAYALYFAKFIRAYAEEKIEIDAVHVQNEPNSAQNFPSCTWTPKTLAEFIGKHLGPRLEQEKCKTQIWLGTIERPQLQRIAPILDHAEAGKFVKGVGFQWGGKDAIALVRKKYPALELMQTETECGDGSNDWRAADHTFSLMKHYFENGAGAYMYWNMVLDETGKSRWGWKQNAMITIDRKRKSATYNPEFWLMKHVSRFVSPGAKKVSIRGDDGDALAFYEAAGKELILIFRNPSEQPKSVRVRAGDSFLQAELPPRSLNSIRIKS